MSEPNPDGEASRAEGGARRRALPIFPLPHVVLFPAVAAPLYIFEPRYRQMTRDALAGDRRIGMVTVDPRNADAMAGTPPIFSIGCEGEIQRSDERPDGTFHILLEGLQRFRVTGELEPEGGILYRRAEVERLPEPEVPSDPQIDQWRVEVIEMLGRLAPERADTLQGADFSNVDDLRFVSALCQAIELPTLEKQKLLEANGVRDRLEQLVSLLEFELAERSGFDGGTRGTVH